MSPWLQRQRHFLDFTLSALWRRKGRNLSLIAVFTLVVFVVSSVILFTRAVRREAGAVLTGAPELVVQRITAGRHAFIPAAYRDKIGRIRGVREVKGRLWGYYYDPVSGANFTLWALADKKLGVGQVAVGHGVARTLGLTLGDNISLTSHSGQVLLLRLVRILPADAELISADLVVIRPEGFRRLYGVPDHLFTDLAVRVANPLEVATVARKIVEILPDARPILREEIRRTYAAVFDWRSGMMIVLLAGALLAFLIFAWDKATGMQLEEKMEIGTLKALGWETGDVLAVKFWEGAVISLTSFLLGFILAYVHVFFFSAVLIQQAIKGWSVIYPRWRLAAGVDFYQIGLLFLLTVVPYTILTIIPAWKAAVTDPDIVMRQ